MNAQRKNPLAAKAEAQRGLAEEQAAEAAAPISPQLAAVRLGYSDLAALEEQIPERLRGHLDTVICGRRLRDEVRRTTIGVSANPPTPSMVTAMVIRHAEEADRLAVASAEEGARRLTRRTCAVLGRTDSTTRKRRTPWGSTLLLSDTGEAVLFAAWVAAQPTDVKANARALLPTTTEQPEPTTRRKSA